MNCDAPPVRSTIMPTTPPTSPVARRTVRAGLSDPPLPVRRHRVHTSPAVRRQRWQQTGSTPQRVHSTFGSNSHPPPPTRLAVHR